MISGKFGEIGELFFEIEIVAVDGSQFAIEVLLDTGFTTGWLTMDIQDMLSLGWPLLEPRQILRTAKGETIFRVYGGQIIIDSQELTVPVVATQNISENLLGLQCLRNRRLIVDYATNLLSLT
jgi:predicted aspartyl protease